MHSEEVDRAIEQQWSEATRIESLSAESLRAVWPVPYPLCFPPCYSLAISTTSRPQTPFICLFAAVPLIVFFFSFSKQASVHRCPSVSIIKNQITHHGYRGRLLHCENSILFFPILFIIIFIINYSILPIEIAFLSYR